MSMNRYANLALAAGLLLLGGCGSNETPTSEKTPNTSASKTDGGAARIDIKHGLDAEASNINTTPKDIAIGELAAMKLPDGVSASDAYGTERMGDFEKSTYRIQGTVESVVHRKDGDYFLKVSDGKGKTVVVEVPDPKLCKGSPLESQITEARKVIEERYHPNDTEKPVGEPATIEGVGFYGWRGKQGSCGHSTTPRLMPGTGFKPGGK